MGSWLIILNQFGITFLTQNSCLSGLNIQSTLNLGLLFRIFCSSSLEVPWKVTLKVTISACCVFVVVCTDNS